MGRVETTKRRTESLTRKGPGGGRKTGRRSHSDGEKGDTRKGAGRIR